VRLNILYGQPGSAEEERKTWFHLGGGCCLVPNVKVWKSRTGVLITFYHVLWGEIKRQKELKTTSRSHCRSGTLNSRGEPGNSRK